MAVGPAQAGGGWRAEGQLPLPGQGQGQTPPSLLLAWPPSPSPQGSPSALTELGLLQAPPQAPVGCGLLTALHVQTCLVASTVGPCGAARPATRRSLCARGHRDIHVPSVLRDVGTPMCSQGRGPWDRSVGQGVARPRPSPLPALRGDGRRGHGSLLGPGFQTLLSAEQSQGSSQDLTRSRCFHVLPG